MGIFMKVLVIIGDCITTNTSANLCHISYLQGLVKCGHQVTLISSEGSYKKDQSIVIPRGINKVFFPGMSLYEKLSINKKIHSHNNSSQNGFLVKENVKNRMSLKTKMLKRLKRLVLASYGVHGTYSTFVRKAKRYSSSVQYDYVISISTPVTSHVLAHQLLKNRRIKAKHWIQIWEDPWFGDAYGFNNKKSIFKEEKRILSLAEKVCYVSPLTLMYQKRRFPESAEKMYWEPVPSYYDTKNSNTDLGHDRYGYFGNYFSAARNLLPFYMAARKTGIKLNICGDSDIALEGTTTINIFPRMELEELKEIEEKTGVLVFLCNKKGGQIPGKIYQYSATNKTILFILDGSQDEKRVIKTYFRRFNRYVFCDNNEASIISAIKRIMSGDMTDVDNGSIKDFSPETIISNILEDGRR